MATAFAYNRLHNCSVGMSSVGHHPQLARSLERILEDAHFSGELILTNRKLKDFPKIGPKYDLQDTVIADLSKNRFCELPEEITMFSFLETLLLYHNSIRCIPETLKRLSSLTYLDMRNNQLTCLPREICLIPLQVLLVSNNRLTSLPDELGRMDRLTDLDVSYNLLASLPARIGELHSLRSLSLRNNQLMYLPRELACLSLVSLDIANNRIASLPLEIRQMSSLVLLNLENNPLTMPPASLCVRGLVHVFKFLETQIMRDVKTTAVGGHYDGYTTLRRTSRNNVNTKMVEHTQSVRTESSYNTYEDNTSNKGILFGKISFTSNSSPNSELIDVPLTSNRNAIMHEGNIDESVHQNQINAKSSVLSYTDTENAWPYQRKLHVNLNEKTNKNLDKIQTYKEFKAALKQQRNQDFFGGYKVKATEQDNKFSQKVEQHGETQIPNGTKKSEISYNTFLVKSNIKQSQPGLTNGICISPDDKICDTGFLVLPLKPIQKVKPSRNSDYSAAQKPNTDSETLTSKSDTQSGVENCIDYLKPNSPMRTVNVSSQVDMGDCVESSDKSQCVGTQGANHPTNICANEASKKLNAGKINRTVTWNQDVPPELLSFTMRREFDRQREETELLTELRNIIETRLKMTLPHDISSALSDGVILCHLANYIYPRSVASIHVPSPGLSKLTMARCRKNVDNFLEACRKIGVDEELMCSYVDVLHDDNKAIYQFSQVQGTNFGIPRISAKTSTVMKSILGLMPMLEKRTNTDGRTNYIQSERQSYKSVSHLQYAKNNNKSDVLSRQKPEVLKNEQLTTATCTKQIISHKEDVLLQSILKNRDIVHLSDAFLVETIDFVGNNYEKIKDGSNIKSKHFVWNEPPCRSLSLHAHKTHKISSNTKYEQYYQALDKSFYVAENSAFTNILKHNFESEDRGIFKNNCGLKNYSKITPNPTQRSENSNIKSIDRHNILIEENFERSEKINIDKATEINESLPSPKKFNIFSIYSMLHVSTTAESNNMVFKADKDIITYENTHDSNILTAILSCLFIFSVFLLTIFPLSV